MECLFCEHETYHGGGGANMQQGERRRGCPRPSDERHAVLFEVRYRGSVSCRQSQYVQTKVRSTHREHRYYGIFRKIAVYLLAHGQDAYDYWPDLYRGASRNPVLSTLCQNQTHHDRQSHTNPRAYIEHSRSCSRLSPSLSPPTLHMCVCLRVFHRRGSERGEPHNRKKVSTLTKTPNKLSARRIRLLI